MICLQDQQRLLSNEVLVVKYFLGCFELRFVSCGIWLILCSYLKFHSCLESRLVKVNPNRPFPSSKKFHFQNEAKCETFVVEMSFNYDANKTHFHHKGFAHSLVLKVKRFGTRKWPICVFRFLN